MNAGGWYTITQGENEQGNQDRGEVWFKGWVGSRRAMNKYLGPPTGSGDEGGTSSSGSSGGPGEDENKAGGGGQSLEVVA